MKHKIIYMFVGRMTKIIFKSMGKCTSEEI